MAAYFYTLLLAVAFLWGYLRGDPNIFHHFDRPGASIPVCTIIGIGLGLFFVWLSKVSMVRFPWAREMNREFRHVLGKLNGQQILALAVLSSVAEEAFFRGAMQPALGFVLTGLIFGALHTMPKRKMIPWTVSAMILGFAFGAITEWTGNLITPIIAHFTINYFNLHLIMGMPVAE